MPALRVTIANEEPVRRGTYVLYWMIAARRTANSFALDHAIARAQQLGRPLVVLEPLRAGYRWASDRLHAFVLDGMADNARAFAAAGITYLPYVEPEPGHGKGLLAALARRACLIVTDEQPGFFLPKMVSAAAAGLGVRVELVDGNGVLPLRAMEREYPSAVTWRRQFQKIAYPHLLERPARAPLEDVPRSLAGGEIAGTIVRRWAGASALLADRRALAQLPIDHGVPPVALHGGAQAGDAAVTRFLEHRLGGYADGRNHPDADTSSGLSPYLHFGHVAAHDVVERVWRSAGWDPSRIAGAKATASKAGWWGLPAPAEAFLDELITWRELGYGFCFHRADFDRWSSLPAWSRATLTAHATDPRPHRYARTELEAARTHDDIWNAAQRQLVGEGRIHNYLRMLWGKKILEWSATPRAALATLIELNNKYAIDGRDPNSYSGICWTLGRFDRPWGPERPIFGTVRYMSSDMTRKKLDLDGYLRRWAGAAAPVTPLRPDRGAPAAGRPAP
ncbi:MAG: deoxyribodipyrimidine photolyase [Myxococcota bacterium]|nr:deoxyribodipyrimidine photolyase [Myxococcota bacterium]